MASFKWFPSERLKHQPQRLANKLPWSGCVVRVCDGDTIAVQRDTLGEITPPIEYIRLAGIDAPELRGPQRGAAIASRDALAAMILNQCVTVNPVRIWRDPYNRIIARVSFHGADVGACLVAAGFAKIRASNKAGTKPVSHRDNP